MYTTIFSISVGIALLLSAEYIRAKYALRPLKQEFNRLIRQQEESRKLPRMPVKAVFTAESVIDRLKSIERERDLLEAEIKIYFEDFTKEKHH